MDGSPAQNQVVLHEATLDEYLAAQEATWSRPETEYRVFDTQVVPDRDGVTTGDSVQFRDEEGRYRVLHDGRHRPQRKKAGAPMSAAPGHIYAVRFEWDEPFEHMIGYAEDCFGPGSVIEFDLGPMKRFPCITDDGAHMLVCAEPRLIPGVERTQEQLGHAMSIERVWPR